MPDVTVYDNSTLQAAMSASACLETAEGLLLQVEKLIARAESAHGVKIDCSAALEDVQATVVSASDEIKQAISKYSQGG